VPRMSATRWGVVAVLALLTLVVVLLDASGRVFNALEPNPTASDAGSAPASVSPAPTQSTAGTGSPTPTPAKTMEGLSLDLPLRPVDPAAGAALTAQDKQLLRRGLAGPELGSSVSALVVDGDGTPLFGQRQATPVVPASTLKLLTATAALEYLGPQTRLRTAVVEGSRPGALVLVGGGDATLVRRSPSGVEPTTGETPAAPASLRQLARATATALADQGRSVVRLAFDDSAFVGPSVSPQWEPAYVTTGVVAPVTALMVDQGLVDVGSGSLARAEDPAQQAASVFQAELKSFGIAVRGPVSSTEAPSTAEVIASVESPPVDLLVQRMLNESDNQLAEALGRLSATAAGRPASFSGAAATLRAAATGAGVPVTGLQAFDASGLSRQDRVTVETLVGCLVAAVADDALRPMLVGLPVAGFSGTLVDRYRKLPSRQAAGLLRGKTGTLTGVTAEAGFVVSSDGGLRVFAVVADRVPFDTDAARARIDDAMSQLAR